MVSGAAQRQELSVARWSVCAPVKLADYPDIGIRGGRIVDPANNFAYDVHQYLDSDGSGTSATIFNDDPTIGVQRLTAFTNWLKPNRLF